MRHSLRKAGFSLVEILVALSVFSIVAAAISSLVLGSSSLQRKGAISSTAQTYAMTYIEDLKWVWSKPELYEAIGTGDDISYNLAEAQALPAGFNQDDFAVTMTCFNLVSNSFSAVECSANPNPDLRRVTVALSQNGEVKASVISEIGRPFSQADVGSAN